MNGVAVIRVFRQRVLDQLDRPIAEIPVIANTTNLTPRYAGSGSPYIIAKAAYLSDAAGDVIIAPAQMYNFNAWVDPLKIPATVVIPDENKATFSFDATDAQPPSVDAKRLKADAILRLYRYEGPRPVLAIRLPDQEGLPADGTLFRWSPLQVHAIATSDFEVTVTRDPTAPLVIRGRQFPEATEESLPNHGASWTLRIRCLRGGIFPAADQEMAFTAPENGYQESCVWEAAAQDRSHGRRTIRFFWRRTGQPVRYGFVEVTCDFVIKGIKTDPSMAATLKSWAYMNPAADDRLIERSFQERYDPNSEDTPPWVTALSPAMVEQWNLESVDGGAIPLAP